MSLSVLFGLAQLARTESGPAREPAITQSLPAAPPPSVEPSAPVSVGRDDRAVPTVQPPVRGWGAAGEPTYLQELRRCEAHALCPKGTMCARSMDTGEVGCFRSTCTGFSDTTSCPPTDSCVSFATGVFRCAPGGFVKVGARCFDFFMSKAEERCEPGLLCVGGVCSTPCSERDACAGRAKCVSLAVGKVCVNEGVLCDDTKDCESGKACVLSKSLGVDGGGGVCVEAGFPNGCVPGGCHEGARCLGSLWGGKFFGHCYTSCAADAECPAGHVCSSIGLSAGRGKVCRRSCSVATGVACGPADSTTEHCAILSETGEGACVASEPVDTSGNAAQEQLEVFSGHPDIPLRR
jgi:hypothetical protein